MSNDQQQEPNVSHGNGRQATQPSQVSGQLKNAQGAVYTAIGSVIPESLGSASYLSSGSQLQQEGTQEVDDAKRAKAAEAVVDSASAKLNTAAGYLTGDQSRQTRGNVDNEKAQWAYKQATSDSPFAIPVPSAEGVRGKVESVLGAVTGDVGKQKEGNVKAEKAAWRDGV